jgi:dienelactone hydrolase
MKHFRIIISLLLGCLHSHGGDLWDMTEIRKHPLDVQMIGAPRKAPLVVAGDADWMSTGDAWVTKKKEPSTATKPAGNDEQLIVEELFFSSENATNGPNRIYCAIARPEKVTGPVPVVLIFHGGGGHASVALALAAARRHPGMAGVAMDYNGQFMPGPKDRVTQWKNVYPDRGRFNLVPDLRNWPMYHNVIAARRAIDFLETQPWADGRRVGCVGISYGGWVALMLAGVDERVKCVTTGVSAGGAQFTTGKASQQLRWEPSEQRALWLANYEPLVHAPHTKAAVFFQLATNDLFFWVTGAAKNLAALHGKKGWVIRPNCNHGAGGTDVPDNAAPAFMRHILTDAPPLPEILDLQTSPDGLRYSWKATGPRPIKRCVLNFSPGKPISPGRYWIEFPATRKDGIWSAEVSAAFGGLASQAFVNAGDEEGIVVSSALLDRDGLDPMSAAVPQWSGGELWDIERGAAAWRPNIGGRQADYEFVAPTGLKLGPQKKQKDFYLLSNSVLLASGIASRHPGIRVCINGNGRAGRLQVTFLRDTASLDERAYTAEIAYADGASEHDVPWSDFKLTTKNVTAPPMPCPFDGLVLSGTRADGTPLIVESIAYIQP